jgi:ribonuclease HI
MTPKSVEIWTDGACSPNPGVGGWGVILRSGDHAKELCGGEFDTTNNRMELQAAIEGLRALKYPCDVDVFTDSQYVRGGILGWIESWKKNNWKTSGKKPVKNEDLWRELDKEVQRHDVIWHWVKGHDGNVDNERADELARQGMQPFKANKPKKPDYNPHEYMA